MASQQSGLGKKQGRNQSKKIHNHQIIYRHQECIPNSTKLDSISNCDRQNLVGSKSNQDLGSLRTVSCDQGELNVRIKTKQQTLSTKSAGRAEKLKENLQSNPRNCNETEKNNEELTKSRKRRLRKQKLLVSLAPSQPLPNKPTLPNKPNPPIEKAPLAKPVSQVVSHPISAPSAPPSTLRVSGSGETLKAITKDQRKRPDKSVGSRNKSIKAKTLIDQSKADIIKTLEEKALSSLLQTLVPLANTSPKKDKPPPTVFSFPDKWTNSASNSKVDGVFYFGETKKQLEKLTTDLKTDSPSSTPTTTGLTHNSISSVFTGTYHNPTSPYNFSSPERDRLDSFSISKQNLNPIEPVKVPQYFPTKVVAYDNSLPLSGAANLIDKRIQSNLAQFSVPENNKSNHSVNASHISEVHSSLVSCKNNLFNTPISADKIAGSQNLSMSALSSGADFNCNKANLLLESDQKQNMKPITVPNTNETREEVLLKREAKKAAKLAAKAKHKNPKDDKEDSLSEKVNPLSNSENNKVISDVEKETPSSGQGEFQDSKLSKSSKSTVNVSTKLALNVSDAPIDKVALKNDSQEKSKKSETKAERRAKQEAQRAAKALGKNLAPQEKKRGGNLIQEKQEQSKPESVNNLSDKKQDSTKVSVQPKPKLFTHLYQEKSHVLSNLKLHTGNLHPAVVRLGIQYSTRVVAGSNARCVALLHALKQMVNDYTTPAEKEFSRGLEEELGPVTAYLHQCRPLAVSMTNALRHIKRTLTQLPNSIPDVEARRKICDVIDTYVHEQIDVAGKAICNTVKQKIANGDVILTYGCSSLVYKILVDSHNSGTKFRVVVVDGMPWREGKEMLRRLVGKGISCTYVLITAASFIMREASKVLLGAHALLANGYVMSRAGSSQVALLARCYNVPVLVCCETHKFCERVQTDAFVYNELGDLCCDNDKSKSRVVPNLTPLSLAYDVTPPDLVSAVVTELAVLPCTSVPVILRIKPSESVM